MRPHHRRARHQRLVHTPGQGWQTLKGGPSVESSDYKALTQKLEERDRPFGIGNWHIEYNRKLKRWVATPA